MSFFKTEDLSKSFGGLIVIEDLSFSLSQGEVMGIIGPDGSGKTTLFNLVAGYIKPGKGSL